MAAWLAMAAHLFKRRQAKRCTVRPMNNRKPLVIAVPAALVLGVAALVHSASLVAEDPPAHRFDWLSGHWCSEGGGELLEEFWLPPEGDLALGVGRTVKNGITTSHEFLRIE